MNLLFNGCLTKSGKADFVYVLGGLCGLCERVYVDCVCVCEGVYVWGGVCGLCVCVSVCMWMCVYVWGGVCGLCVCEGLYVDCVCVCVPRCEGYDL